MTDWHSSGSLQPLRMGNAFASSVDFQVGKKSLKNRGRHRRLKFDHRKRSISAPTLPTTDSTWSTISLRLKRRKVQLHEDRLEYLYYGGEDIEGIESHLQKFPFDDNASKVKFHKFITAWRGALSYPHSKMQASSTGIPVAATSTCKDDISRWKRYARHCVQCSSAKETEQLLADLLHKESLKRFVKNTETIMMGTSSIIIKEDLKGVRLYENVGDLEDGQKQSLQMSEDEDENNLTLTIQFNFPPLVHIEHPPQAVRHVTPNEELIKRSWERKKKTISETGQSWDRHSEGCLNVGHIMGTRRVHSTSSLTSTR